MDKVAQYFDFNLFGLAQFLEEFGCSFSVVLGLLKEVRMIVKVMVKMNPNLHHILDFCHFRIAHRLYLGMEFLREDVLHGLSPKVKTFID